ncbi:MAG: hypothetical protein QW478_10700 [Candidatus Micrarchaeaceae archaeon]
MRKVLLLFMFSFFAELGISSAAPTTPTTYALPVTFIGISMLALTISIDVVAIGYIIARLVPGTGIRSWLDNEYWEIAKSAMIIIGIYAILAFVGSVSLLVYNSYSSGLGASAPCSTASFGTYSADISSLETVANCYLNNIKNNVSIGIQNFYTLSVSLGALRSITLTIAYPITITTFILQFGFSSRIYANQLLEQGPTTGTYESMINDLFGLIITPLAFMIVVQQVGLPYIIIVALGFLIPLGLVFRAFPFIRNIGGTLIGIGIALAVIYPATLVLLNIPVSNAFTFVMPSQLPQVTGSSSGALGFLGILSSVLPLAYSNYIYQIYSFISIYIQFSMYFVLQLLLFILDLVIVYALGDNIAKMLGGTFRLSLGEKLKIA